jgi:AcrR family transcriptional regulator
MGELGGKAGPRFERGDAAPRMRDVARSIIEEQGVSSLSFRTLAKDPRLLVSHSAPLHHFHTIAGLLGAVAAEAFDELAHDLRKQRESAPTAAGNIEGLAQQLATFSIKNPRLYHAIHSAELWEASTEHDEQPMQGRQNPPSASARKRAAKWIKEAVKSRDAAFTEFVAAAEELLQASHRQDEFNPVDVARMVTTLVDGYLFQFLNEKVESADPLDDIARLVQLALIGVSPEAFENAL